MKDYEFDCEVGKVVKIVKIVLIGGLFVVNPLLALGVGLLASCFSVKKKKDD